MSDSLLLTKLYIPPARLKVVVRPRLIEQLNEGLFASRKLTLISAPAGFGKTTLASEWAAGCGLPAAWLSMDEGDNDPTRFVTYLVAALQTVAANIGAGVLGVLQASQLAPTEFILITLLNEIATMPDNFVLVLDDYHVIDSKPVDEALTFLLDHLPPQMHLVIATREDPPLPLARLRVRGQLTELRAADLRFTPAEAADFLNRMMGLKLRDADIAALEARTEGWVAGLQLAALSMLGRSDTAGFIQAFSGSHRFVLDYLVEEVLQHQSEKIRSFLLQTAILNRLCAALCNAITEREDSKEILEVLERSNLFLIPLDDQRQWYRYHHLFADVLQTHLMETQPEQVFNLHQRASVWYEQNGLPPDAIRHALAAKDFERAAELIELAWSAMDRSYQSATWIGWVKTLPNELIRVRPVLSVGFAWALLDGGELEMSEALLHDAERWLDTPTDKMVVVDKEQFRSLPASIATARAYRSLALGNVPGAVKYAEQALKLTPEDDQIRLMQAASLLGLAQYTSGDLEAAEQSLADFHTDLRKTGEILTLIGITFLLAEIRMALGRLHEAENIYQQSLRLAACQDEQLPLGTADLYRGLSELFIEQGDLEAAAQHLLTSQKLGEQNPLTGWLHRLYVTQARLKEAQGDLDGTLALLDEAARVYIRGPLPDVHPIAALKTQIWLKQGRLVEALGWAREQGLAVDDDMSYSREFEHITLARVLIAAGKNDREGGSLDEATRLLGRLLQAAESGGRMGSVIQIQLLQALAFQAQDNLPHALAALERALTLAEPEGYVRIFVDEGEAMRLLIEKQSNNRDHPLSGYTDKILAAFTQPAAAPKSANMHQKPDMIEPLSERELEVLRLLRGELSGPEIAQHLIVSINTLRTHTKSIFNKLGVNNRRAAIRRAEELDLF
ncbi:MAG: helix-turn-helix transcriptional regulator [Chloroflexi bacterium HGW-Chloroflexi-10]|nr:MAG: helix-turn-helix transcriptional regulator [Chloroflexi bacterium HGW-Chloroflexi-10]